MRRAWWCWRGRDVPEIAPERYCIAEIDCTAEFAHSRDIAYQRMHSRECTAEIVQHQRLHSRDIAQQRVGIYNRKSTQGGMRY